MGKPALLRHVESDAGTLSGGNWLAGLPLANIRDRDVAKVARSTNLVAGSTQWRIDFGASITRFVNVFALFGHNGTAAGTVRFVLTDSADDSTTRVYNSGLLPLLTPTIVWGAEPWGGFAWDGDGYPEGFTQPRTVVHLMPAAATARYLFVYLSDPTNPAGYIDVGRFMAGPYWSPGVSFNFAASWQLVDPSTVRRTPAGRRVAENLPRYRVFNGTLGFLSENDAWGFVLEWQRQGKQRDVLFVQDIEDGDALFQRRTMRCALADISPIVQPLFNRWSVDVQLEELI